MIGGLPVQIEVTFSMKQQDDRNRRKSVCILTVNGAREIDPNSPFFTALVGCIKDAERNLF